MAEPELIDALIATYRELNGKVRSLPEDRLTMGGANGSVREVIARLRDSELRFSQALKERVTGVELPQMFGEGDAPVLGTEHEDDSTPVLLSQFGTARESTLAMLRGLPAEEWHRSADGGGTITEGIRQLVENDRRQVERINGLLGAP